MERRDKEPEAPYIHPGVSPDVARYQADIRARRQQAMLPKVSEPVAGGPGPAIPRLDGAVQRGMTMEQMAARERYVEQPRIGGIVDADAPPAATAQAPAAVNLTPADILPSEAANDPTFQTGTGAMLAASQPHLALKYGVYRNGLFIPPQKLRPTKPQLRPETIRDLETLEHLRTQQQGTGTAGGNLLDSEDEAEQAVAAGPAGAAATIGNVPGDKSNRPLTEEERSKLKSAIDRMDEFDFDSFRQSMMKDILNNPDQQKIIEAKLKPLDITDMIVNGYVTQDVPIVAGLTFTFRSMSGLEDLEIKRLIMEESKSLEVSERYLLDKYAFMSMTIGLTSINNKPFGDVYDQSGEFNDDKFKAKFKKIIRLPLHMLASIGLNQMWFEQRARKLYVAEKVGNG
jgi:hypothetical protein